MTLNEGQVAYPIGYEAFEAILSSVGRPYSAFFDTLLFFGVGVGSEFFIRLFVFLQGKCKPQGAWDVYCLSKKIDNEKAECGEHSRAYLLGQILKICREAGDLDLSKLALDEIFQSEDMCLRHELDVRVLPEILLSLAAHGDLDRCAQLFMSFLDSDSSVAESDAVLVWRTLSQIYRQNQMWMEIIELCELYKETAGPTADMLSDVVMAKCQLGLGKEVPQIFESLLCDGREKCALELFTSTTELLASRKELTSIYELYQLFNRKDVRLSRDSYVALISAMRECRVSSKQYLHVMKDMDHIGVTLDDSLWDTLFLAVAQEGNSDSMGSFLAVCDKSLAQRPDSEFWMFPETLLRFLTLSVAEPHNEPNATKEKDGKHSSRLEQKDHLPYIRSGIRAQVFSALMDNHSNYLVPRPVMQELLAACQLDQGWEHAEHLFVRHEEGCRKKSFGKVRCVPCTSQLYLISYWSVISNSLSVLYS